ncbi:DNA mismatch repair endonuclease MutL [Candidatus Roizmanbacteria bacterium]|nr:DNA mismatch repair endonuclease MutL [Candidatus Roizmanbacteria bacterium]
MGIIHTLSQDTIAKIAAGEVVERPAFAVKELIENAVDAGATSLRIDIEKSGLQKISVIDNGEGMSKEDLLLSFQPHTTSKLSSSDELNTIRTLGFRGEALASIAAISHLVIESRNQKEPIGFQIEIENGEPVHSQSVGMAEGTRVVAENIFESIPARRKFLKSPTTEFRHILEVVTRAALSFPRIAFSLSHNKKLIFSLPENQSIEERLKTLFGTSIFENLIPLSYQVAHISLTGFITKPHITAYHQSKHYLFVNKRAVKNTFLSQTAKDAYGTLLDPHAFPIVILFITLPSEMVDVNIHPRKEQIAFFNTQTIADAIKGAVSESLRKHSLTFHDLRWKGTSVRTKEEMVRETSGRKGLSSSYAAHILKDEIFPWEQDEFVEIKKSSDVIQINNTYLIIQTANGYLLIDQHAAHERILYEQFSHTFQKQKDATVSHELTEAKILPLSFTEAEILRSNLSLFARLGFQIEEFGTTTFKIDAVPQLFKDRDIGALIREIIEDLMEDVSPKKVDNNSHRMLAYLACRSAIKAGIPLTKDKARQLVKDLFLCDNPYTCPHGRPTHVEITLKELDKLFRRK